MSKQEIHSKAFLLEGQIMWQISELNKKLDALNVSLSKGEIPKSSYEWHKSRYLGAIDYLMITLTCYDNPLSNFIKYEETK